LHERCERSGTVFRPCRVVGPRAPTLPQSWSNLG
jgi:hypothetical protein